LSNEPTTVRELAAYLGMRAQAVHKQMGRLRKYKLAERVLDGWVRGPAELEAVALELGTVDEPVRLQARFDQERAAWRDVLQPPRPSGTPPDGTKFSPETIEEALVGTVK
jgi:hypothetical protein